MIGCSYGSCPITHNRKNLGAEGAGAPSPAHLGLGQSPDISPRVGFRQFAQGTSKDRPAPGSRTAQKLSLNVSVL